MRVTYYGQACLLIEAAGKKILTDPWLTEGAYFGTWFHTHLLADAGVTIENVTKDIDYVFLSHEHQDHVDPETLRHLKRDTPVLICKFLTSKFRRYLESLGLTNIIEVPSGERRVLSEDLEITILATAEYTNDAALLVESENCRVLNETDCKLGYKDLQKIGEKGIDVGFFMFSGANWYPMMYDYPETMQRDLVKRRRSALLRSFVQRIKVTRPKFAVPAAGPCTVLDRDRLWLNNAERGIFIDPEEAIRTLMEARLPVQPLYMGITDIWDSSRGFEPHAPSSVRIARDAYIQQASEKMAEAISNRRKTETSASNDLPDLFENCFNELIKAQTPAVRNRIDAKVGFVVSGAHGGTWTLDFTSESSSYVREGLADDWTYKMEVEDKLLWPFLIGTTPFFEDLLLSLRVSCSRRPDTYNEALYHFFYEPDPEKLHSWYVKD